MRLLNIALSLTCAFGVMTSVFGQASFGATASDLKELKVSEADYASAKKLFQKKPDATRKAALVKATDRYAMTSMMSPALAPKVKYRQALRLYREALKLDPSNHEAKHNSDLIVSIYKSMHRPVPN
jgi:hypothetical protein